MGPAGLDRHRQQSQICLFTDAGEIGFYQILLVVYLHGSDTGAGPLER
jgi:hypothetical protein